MPVDAWRRKQVVKDLAVVGHGRGATSYAAYWLIKQGIRVEHERLGTQGIVESGFSVPTWGVRAGVHQGLTRDNFIFKHKVCILRDPYKVIGTYEQIEHPRAIFGHCNHIPELVTDLMPADFRSWSDARQIVEMEENRALRVNTIARSAVRWTQSGIDWADEAFRAEDEWHSAMPKWLKARKLWVLSDMIPRPVPANKVNHRKGRRLTPEQINEMLRPNVAEELADFRLRIGYE